jgi:TPR repeat protein
MTAVHGMTSSWHGPRLATRPSNSVNVTVPQAVVWYRKAADQGIAVAQFNVGLMFDRGLVYRKTTRKPSRGTARPPIRDTRPHSTTLGKSTVRAKAYHRTT